ncbi:Bardet-Biedl syndrome 8 protein [Intoshia linei]|uniref:Bardet-Biedl syndrome 8 protein n=1 Tax=Intoshia linei TaxID=1819745 RepID=A0A177BES2_9BILA|nr:Bardet-Biedl syndrome 8 protein [Intoshia linei]
MNSFILKLCQAQYDLANSKYEKCFVSCEELINSQRGPSEEDIIYITSKSETFQSEFTKTPLVTPFHKLYLYLTYFDCCVKIDNLKIDESDNCLEKYHLNFDWFKCTNYPYIQNSKSEKFVFEGFNTERVIFLVDQYKLLDFRMYAKNDSTAQIFFDFVYHFSKNKEVCLEICDEILKNKTKLHFGAQMHGYWLLMQAIAYYSLGLFDDALKSAKKSNTTKSLFDAYLMTINIYAQMKSFDEAINSCKEGLHYFRNNLVLMILHARLIYLTNENVLSKNVIPGYVKILNIDSFNIESMSCLACYYYKSFKYEQSLNIYRRMLICGVKSPAIYVNIALSCARIQKHDLIYTCFERAISLSDETNPKQNTKNNDTAQIYFNLAYIAILIREDTFSYHCLRLCIFYAKQNSPLVYKAYNNIGVLEISNNGSVEKSMSLFKMSSEYVGENVSKFNEIFSKNEKKLMLQADTDFDVSVPISNLLLLAKLNLHFNHIPSTFEKVSRDNLHRNDRINNLCKDINLILSRPIIF